VHSACLYSIAGPQTARIIPRIFRITAVRGPPLSKIEPG
jgi:hypothetical protein